MGISAFIYFKAISALKQINLPVGPKILMWLASWQFEMVLVPNESFFKW